MGEASLVGDARDGVSESNEEVVGAAEEGEGEGEGESERRLVAEALAKNDAVRKAHEVAEVLFD